MRAIRRLFGLFFQASFLEPIKWLIQLAGLYYAWMKSRRWAVILLYGFPILLLFGLMVLDWRGGRIDRKQLSQWYLDLGELELGAIEESFDYSGISRSIADVPSSTDQNYSRDQRTGFSNVQRENSGVSGYGEMLFRRVHLLSPSEQSYFVIGLKMLEGGAHVQAQKVLSRIAPDDRVRDYRAHGVMAAILLDKIARTADESLFPAFQHHASAGARWRYIPPEVLAASSEICWREGNRNQAFELLDFAAENRPEFFLLYYERAVEAGLIPMAESIRDRAISRFQRLLTQNPQDVYVRSQLAAMECTSEDGLARAEKLLRDGEQLSPGPVLSRALSEVYLRALRVLPKERMDNTQTLTLIDRAMAADPGNPNIADSIADLMQRGSQGESQSQLVSALNQELASGNATTGTHAMLSEYYLSKNALAQAAIHLEQVYRIAPTAAKYSNDLAHLYASEGRLKDALIVANRALSIISQRQLLTERYVDDLMDTLGKIYQEQQNWAEAIPVYELCLTLNSERPETRRQLAQVYRKSGKQELAEQQEKLAVTSEQMANRRKTLVQMLSSPEALLDLVKEIGNSGSEAVGTDSRPVRVDSDRPVKPESP